MKIDVLEDKKRVEVWVGDSEKDSEYVKLSLESLVKKYASKRFLNVHIIKIQPIISFRTPK